MNRRVLTIMIALLAMVTGVWAKSYNLYIRGVQVTDNNKDKLSQYASRGTISFDGTTLTLNNVTISATSSKKDGIELSEENITLRIEGANNVYGYQHGITVKKNATITGSGRLTANGDVVGISLTRDNTNSVRLIIADGVEITATGKSGIRGGSTNCGVAIRGAGTKVSAKGNESISFGDVSILLSNGLSVVEPKGAKSSSSGVVDINERPVKGEWVRIAYPTPTQIAINTTNFPDDNFRAYVKEECDKNGDDSLNDSEVRVARIDVPEREISNLKGIEHFFALRALTCFSNQLTSLDLSKNIALTTLICNDNQLKSLDLSKNVALTDLYCSYNQLKSLDMQNNTKLLRLICSNNQLTSLDLQKNTQLRELRCYNNQIKGTEMDAMIRSLPKSGGIFKALAPLFGDQNELTISQVAAANARGWTPLYWTGDTWDDTLYEWAEYQGSHLDINAANFPDEIFREYVKNNCQTDGDDYLTHEEIAAVTRIIVPRMNIASLKGVEYFKNLTELQCWMNQLTSLNVSKNTALTALSCLDNQLTALNVSKNTALTDLRCADNQLTALDLSNNTALTYLDCCSNQLTALDLSNNTALTVLWCASNQLTDLDLSNHAALTELECTSNQLITLTVSNDAHNLERITCYRNRLKNTGVDQFVESLPEVTGDKRIYFYLMYDYNERNVMTENQPAAARKKGWTPYYSIYAEIDDYDYNDNWQEYFGATFFGVDIDEVNFPDSIFRQYVKDNYDNAYVENYLTYEELDAVKEMNVSNKGIANLKGFELFTKLEKLDCSHNQLTKLDLGRLPSYLEKLDCSYNNISSLGKLKPETDYQLKQIKCYRNKIKASRETFGLNECLFDGIIYLIDASDPLEENTYTDDFLDYAEENYWYVYYANTNYRIKDCIAINETNFPDAIFRQWVKDHCDDGDEYLTDAEIAAVNRMYVSSNVNLNIASLKGIEYFTALTSLNCAINNLTSLDVSKNTALTSLSCSSNQLTSLDVSKNTALTYLSCDGNQLTSLDLSNNVNLQTIYCNTNQLTSLVVSENSQLKKLFFDDNRLKGAAIDALIASLPTWEDNEGKFYAIAPKISTEQNVITTTQVAAAKAKGWTTYYWPRDVWGGAQFMEYAGSEPVATAIPSVNSDADNASPSYNLQGQHVSNGFKGIVIVNGKKVLKK